MLPNFSLETVADPLAETEEVVESKADAVTALTSSGLDPLDKSRLADKKLSSSIFLPVLRL
jgi:hypothetical protein